jgi:hypothetical protein
MYHPEHSQIPTWQVLAGTVVAFLLVLGWFAFGILPTGAILLLTITAFTLAVAFVMLGIGARRLATNVMYGDDHHAMLMSTAMPLPEFAAPSQASGSRGPTLLQLSPEERDFMIEKLRADVGDLRMEIAATDSYAMREDLKQTETMMRGILARLSTADDTTETKDNRADLMASDDSMVDMRLAAESFD